MIRRMFCLLCAAVLLCTASAASAAKAKKEPTAQAVDFDLTFSLNPEAFPLLQRERAAGYAALLGVIGLKGRYSWSEDTKSMELDAVLYFLNKPSLSYPFRLYGSQGRLFLTSPLLDNEVLFFDMSCLMEFCEKAKNTLSIPLPYLAFLYPFTTEHAFRPLTRAWNNVIKAPRKEGTVTQEHFEELSRQWDTALQGKPQLQRWIMALMDISKVPGIIEAEFFNLPRYYEKVTGGEALTVSAGKYSEIWQDAAGNTLFSRQQMQDSFSLKLSLPASEGGYVPDFSVSTRSDGQTASFSVSASVTLDPAYAAESAWGDEEYYGDEYGDYDEYSEDGEVYEEVIEEVAEDTDIAYVEDDEEYSMGSSKPSQLFFFHTIGSGFPVSLPADSVFTATATVLGEIYPNYSFLLQGTTKKDGAVSISLCKPGSPESAPTEILHVSGTLVPAVPETVPDYKKQKLDKVYYIFAMNDQLLADFSKRMIPLIVKGFLSFVAEAPTSACQALLDDLTDLGVLGMFLHQ